MRNGGDVVVTRGVDEGLSVGVPDGSVVTVGDPDGEGLCVGVIMDEGVGVRMAGEPLGVTDGSGVALGSALGPFDGRELGLLVG